MRFLIDECLTIDLVTVAHRAGHEAQHVAHVGKAGWRDWNVARPAAEGDFVMVTNNANRFPPAVCNATASCRADRHQSESRDRAQQRQLFRGALDELARLGELINSVLEMDIEGDEVTFSFYDLPADGG